MNCGGRPIADKGIVAMVFSKVDFCKLRKFAILHALKYEGFKCLLLNY